MASCLSLDLNTKFSWILLWRSIRCNLLLRCVCWDRWIVDLWSDYSWILTESSLNSFIHDYFSFVFQYKVLLDLLGDLFDIILYAVCLSRSDELWVYDQDYLWTIFESSEFFYVWLVIFASLFELSVWFGLLDWSFLQWEKCLALGSILRCPFPVTAGAARHVLYCCHRG